MRALSVIADQLDRQRGYLFPWAPVFFGTGIAIYFALRFEPDGVFWIVLGGLTMAVFVLFRATGPLVRLGLTALILTALGFSTAGFRAHSVAAEVLPFRYYGPIEGRIIKIDRSASDALRLTLDRVVLSRLAPHETPERVRVALHGTQGFLEPEPGLTVALTGHLSPPGGAVEPGGYDFRRQAWFQRLGAVGYTRTPVLALAAHEGREAGLWLYRMRTRISAAVQGALAGREGAFAAAITTGDRSGMDRATLDALRAANLAHLLAISGLHMGLLTGFVFAALRLIIFRASLRWPVKKFAAIGALLAGVVYLALSGGNVATERAFIMVAVMFTALLFDRRAITLRAVAVAALIVLTLRPEALYGPGFQMSFAATTALVVVFGAMRDAGVTQTRWPRVLRIVAGVALSSLVAGLATAPIAAAHFNQVPHYGLVANVVSVPLMGAVIIPGAVLAAVLAPFGLAWIGLGLMKPAITWILAVADTVADWSGALSFVVAPSAAVLPVLTLGFLMLAIWQGRARWIGVPLAILALGLWSNAERPTVLISQTGGLVGVMTDSGRALSKTKGDGFAAGSWLENDGDPTLQTEAAGRDGFVTSGRLRWFKVGDTEILHATGKKAAAVAIEYCGRVALIVVNVVASAPKRCLLYDINRLRDTGALAIEPESAGVRVVTARELVGDRLWSD
ncbi:MAG: DUF4131 domain-containing protein [Silicimonas sp.]|nr:DUF4131 domain-containing protein [Silicimonas sp.]